MIDELLKTLTLLYLGSPGTYFAWVRKYIASFPRTLYGAKPATDWNVIEGCGFGNSPETVRCMITNENIYFENHYNEQRKFTNDSYSI